MSKEAVYNEMKEMFGMVPVMFTTIPEATLDLEWRLFKETQFAPGPIPNKYRELIGIALAAVTKCRYCAFYHTELARLNGATEAEIEDAVRYAKSSAGWSAYLNGMQVDFERFKGEILTAYDHVRAKSR